MRQGPNSRRSRGRGNGGGGGNAGGGGGGGGGNRGRQNVPLRHQNFESNGPDVRIRGNAWQVHEKYQALARDASTAGDRVQAENYMQHAEHYLRIINQIQESEVRQRGGAPAQGQGQGHPQNGAGQPDGDYADEGMEESDGAEERTSVNA